MKYRIVVNDGKGCLMYVDNPSWFSHILWFVPIVWRIKRWVAKRAIDSAEVQNADNRD